MKRSILTTAALVVALFSIGTPALAGPCERMLGARWLIYFERNWDGVLHMTVGTIDFASISGAGAKAYVAFGPAYRTGQLPNPAGLGYPHGAGQLRSAGCINLTEPMASVSLNTSGDMHIAVAPDGQSGVIHSLDGTPIGYAERLPPPPVTPQRVR